MDFGLAQKTAVLPDQAHHRKPPTPPACKKRLGSSDFANSSSENNNSSSPSKRRRTALANKTNNASNLASANSRSIKESQERTPDKESSAKAENVKYDHYNRRGHPRKQVNIHLLPDLPEESWTLFQARNTFGNTFGHFWITLQFILCP